jgi:hypothetical protein
MVALPLWVNVVLVLGAGAIGVADAVRLTRRWPDLSLDKVLGRERYLYLPVAMLFIDHPTAGPESHAVARFAHAGTVEVWDPLTGSPISAPSLARNWHGRAVICAK